MLQTKHAITSLTRERQKVVGVASTKCALCSFHDMNTFLECSPWSLLIRLRIIVSCALALLPKRWRQRWSAGGTEKQTTQTNLHICRPLDSMPAHTASLSVTYTFITNQSLTYKWWLHLFLNVFIFIINNGQVHDKIELHIPFDIWHETHQSNQSCLLLLRSAHSL